MSEIKKSETTNHPLVMTTEQLHKWAREKRADLIVKHATPGTIVRYAGSDWEVAHVKQFLHGPMIGIYDEPPGKHIDYLHPSSVTIPLSQNAIGDSQSPTK